MFFSSAQSVYLTNSSAFSASKLFLILDHTKSYIQKTHSIDSEVAGHAHKLDMKLQEFVWEWFFSFYCAHVCQALLLRSELTNNTLRKQRWGTFLYPQFWMP